MPPQHPNQPLTSVHPDADHSALWKILAVMIGILIILGGVLTYTTYLATPATQEADKPLPPPPPPPPAPTE